MCGRYGVHKIKKAIEKGLELAYQFEPNYNAAPTQALPIIADNQPHLIQGFHWGLIPSWSKDGKLQYSTINARSEEIFQKPIYRSVAMKQRCLVLANNFYEWKKLSPRQKEPYLIAPVDQELFAFAGVWDEWSDKTTGETKKTFSIITTSPLPTIASIHDRMPVILLEDHWGQWLQAGLKQEELQDLMVGYQKEMTFYKVHPSVGQVANNLPTFIEPYKPGESFTLF
ncbi:MAG TPA: SOS response-associated peptidase [Cytophagaceae bacterium]|jgi:putative SOS response-associated peptidase YedK